MSAPEWTALFTAIATTAAIAYVELTRRLWRESAKQREANLLLMLMVEYDNLRDSVIAIRRWYLECASASLDAVERFQYERGPDWTTESAESLDNHRHRVSRFFVRTRKLARAGYLSEDLVAMALGGRAIEDVFLKMVDPLDSTKPSYGASDRKFYTELLRKHPRPQRPTE